MTISPEEHSCGEQQQAAVEHTGPFIGSDISDEAYRQIAEILQQQQDFALGGYKDLCIKRRIATRIRAAGSGGLERYIELLAVSSSEQQKLLAALSVHVSHFFRNPSTYKMLEKQVLPELVSCASRQRSKLRIWSVGCAHGEEPYSLALLCQKLSVASEMLTIIGTDLSPDALVRAKRGCYEKNRLLEVPDEILRSSFDCREKRYCLTAEVKKAVRFFRHDILSDQPFYRADLILCRNVLIYFSREQQQRILQILAAALPRGGYLVLGRAETLVGGCWEFLRCIDPAERIYQRLESDEHLLPTSVVQQLQEM